MPVSVVWNFREWGRAVAELPVQGAWPCRTVLVPNAGIAHVLRRELISSGQQHALAGTRFVSPRIAAIEVLRGSDIEFEPREENLRTARLSALFRSDLLLRHFPIDLLRSTPGWDDAFARSIADLESAGLRPDELDPRTSLQLQDVLTVWRALDESAGSCWTSGRIYREASLLLESNSKAWNFPGPALVFVTSGLAAVEARFLRAIPDLTVALIASRPVRKRYIERMENLLGSKAGDLLRSSEAPRAAKSERDLLASYLFEPPVVLADSARPRSKGPDGTVEIEEHAGVDAELEATAHWVIRQIADGIALEEIAVLAPPSNSLVELIAVRLARLPWKDGDFPVHVANGLPFTHSAAGARVLSVLRALRGHLAAVFMPDLLPAMRLADEGGRHLARGGAMDLVSSLGTVGGNPAHPKGALEWSRCAQERQAGLDREIAQKEAAAGQGNEDLDFTVRHSKRVAADLRALRPAFDALVAVARSTIQNAPLSVLWPMLREFLEQWLLQPGHVRHTVLNNCLDLLATDPICGALTGDDALKVIEDAILSTRVPVARFGEPAVFVGTVQGAAGLGFTAVRVIGLTEGHLPSLLREDPVMPDVLRQALNSRQGKNALLPLTADRTLEDLHVFDLVARGADRVLALSAPRLDAERSEREPSSVILEAAAALARPNRITGEQGAVIPERAAVTRDAFMPARAEGNRFRQAFPLSEAAWQDGVAQNALGLPARWRELAALDLARIDRLGSDSAAGPMDGMMGALAGELPMPGLSPDYPISASGIAQLLSCPHVFLLNRLLYFQEPSEPPPQREIGQPYYGSLIHEIAAKFYADNGPEFCAQKNTLNHWRDVADRLVGSAFQEFL